MKKSRRNRRSAIAGDTRFAGDTRVSDAITVAWMLATLATLLAEISGLACLAIVAWIGPESLPVGVVVLPWVMWVSAIVTGMLSLILGAIAARIRSVSAPPAISITSACIGVLPIIALLFLIR